MRSNSICLLISLFLLVPATAAAQDGYQTPPAALANLVDAPPTPSVSVSPDRTRLAILDRPQLPSIEKLSQPELRIAGLRINPRTGGPSRSQPSTGISLLALEDGSRVPVSGLPAELRIANVSWSPDGAHLALALLMSDHYQLWVIDAERAEAHRLGSGALNVAISGSAFSWEPDSRSLLVRLVPPGRGSMPARPETPSKPVIQEASGIAAPARTYQDLLKSPYDEALFAHFAVSNLVRIGLDGSVTDLVQDAIMTQFSPSPDGRYILMRTVVRPFSYLVPIYRFPTRIEVLTSGGQPVHRVADLPAAENVPTGFESVAEGPRSVSWRPDAPATMYWVEARDGGNARAQADVRDVVLQLEAPFDGPQTRLAALGLRYGGVQWSDHGFALVTESWWSTRMRKTSLIPTDGSAAEPRVLFEGSTEDRFSDPGRPMSRLLPNGWSVLLTDASGGSLYLAGAGYSPEGQHPFIHRYDIESGETREVFRSRDPFYESPVAWIDFDEGTMLVSRQSVDMPPNYFVRDAEGGYRAVTDFPHPHPELADVSKEFITYTREDGVTLSATLYLPPGYDAERDGPLPTFVWAYPREFKSAAAAGQVSSSPYRFTRISTGGAVPFVTRGYAILDGASMPIVGEGDRQPNDSFVEQLVTSAEAAITEGVRRGVVDADRVAIGGHSYGAFMTANLLAHSDLFRAGIARSGAYNRTLTPFGFQAEPRTFWEAPEIYFAMSPFMHADDVNEPILLIHGQADNNSGTFPIQSERYYAALKGHGATARLVMLPNESHGYRARESVLHMLWEMDTWLDTYVRQAAPRNVPVEGPTG